MSGAKRWKPARVFHPSEIIRDELEARGWSVADLARAMGRTESLVAEIVDGREQITPKTAWWLAAAFHCSPEAWLNMQHTWNTADDAQRSDAPPGESCPAGVERE